MNLSAIRTLLQHHARFAVAGLERDARGFGPDWLSELAELLDRLYPEADKRAAALRAYARFSMAALRRQTRFERSGHYPPRAASDVLGDDFMREQYLPGLLLSHQLWPHHYRQQRFFREAFLPRLAGGEGRLLEVGVGSGLYARLALQAWPRLQLTGLDLSAAALEFTGWHLACYGRSARLLRHDIEQAPLGESFDALVCVEVLEHLDHPLPFLQALVRHLRPGAPLFLSAALNAADIDHVQLYRTPAEVFAQVQAAGLRVEHHLHAPARPVEGAGPVPSILALILTRESDAHE